MRPTNLFEFLALAASIVPTAIASSSPGQSLRTGSPRSRTISPPAIVAGSPPVSPRLQADSQGALTAAELEEVKRLTPEQFGQWLRKHEDAAGAATQPQHAQHGLPPSPGARGHSQDLSHQKAEGSAGLNRGARHNIDFDGYFRKRDLQPKLAPRSRPGRGSSQVQRRSSPKQEQKVPEASQASMLGKLRGKAAACMQVCGAAISRLGAKAKQPRSGSGNANPTPAGPCWCAECVDSGNNGWHSHEGRKKLQASSLEDLLSECRAIQTEVDDLRARLTAQLAEAQERERLQKGTQSFKQVGPK
ncbi:hypothetical protein MCOR22_006767 [Pyricularia oryzae]|nr:hypothetical protein MCOR22_006767 [Pyricularia oryzae]